MLPGPTNVPERVMRAMMTHIINHRSDDFVELYTEVIEKTQQVFQTQNDNRGEKECSQQVHGIITLF